MEAVRGALDELNGQRLPDWPQAVKTALCKAGREAFKDSAERVKLFASGVDDAADGGEWLCDVTWLLYDAESYIRCIPLVAQAQWLGRRSVQDDFQKLLLARAELRVMVFDRNYWDSSEQAMAELAPHVTACERTEPDDIYLLAGWTLQAFEYCLIDGTGAARRLA